MHRIVERVCRPSSSSTNIGTTLYIIVNEYISVLSAPSIGHIPCGAHTGSEPWSLVSFSPAETRIIAISTRAAKMPYAEAKRRLSMCLHSTHRGLETPQRRVRVRVCVYVCMCARIFSLFDIHSTGGVISSIWVWVDTSRSTGGK